MPEVEIPRADASLPAYLAVPDGGDSRPGVVIIHDALGMTTDLHRQADWLAGAGFVSLAPDLLHWGWRPRCVVAAMRALAAGRGRPFDEIESARTWLVARPECTGRIGVIGFCLGGGFAVLLAAGGNYQAASVNYGAVPDDADGLLADACPVVAGYGGLDRSVGDAPQRLEHALDANDISYDIRVYPDAGHSFLNDHPSGEMPWWAALPARFARAGYHDPSAVDARARIESFFHEHLDVTEPRS
ncbi:dienelactone hydrolase family protein [Gordonia sp. HNM0687]|uniref:Dienelactone hydrolase family protein n=1 Tax=Gordonia mangrovi TaxID=2665643 RepID=A0A6L7GQZ2_9ACTN|nr:dienelactone hydrolase family protein [Gordonia mangrovi]MXP22306.1 dienelactone hydrolase family protein [Gordonia mangrovi]UVF77799.1 dienelactone hydrolase family protein [Gordonia mangrovi]